MGLDDNWYNCNETRRILFELVVVELSNYKHLGRIYN